MQARKIEEERPAWDMYLQFRFLSWIQMSFYDHSYNRCETFARVKAKREGACATSFTVVTRVIVRVKRQARQRFEC